MMRCATSIFFTFFLTLSAHAAESVWTLITGDFQSQAVRLLSLDAKGARVVPTTGGDEQFVSIDRFLEISRSMALAGDNKGFLLELSGGDRLTGQPAGMSSESIIWNHPLLGEMPVPLRQVRALVRSAGSDERAGARAADVEPANEDVVSLVNGDAVRGIITDLHAQTLSIQPADAAESVPIEMQSVARVSFAAVGSPDASDSAAEASPKFRVRLADGSAITANQAEVTGDQVKLAFGETVQPANREIALGHVAAIEQIDGPVTWLSSLAPAEAVQTPFFETAWPAARMNQSVTGESLRFGSRTYAHGIGVHAYSRLTFNLTSARHRAFRTQYAIDGNRPYADVTVRITLDGDRVVHEQREFGAGTISPVVLIVVSDAKTLTLEVDYGQFYDVQDRFNWIEPALLRQMPAAGAAGANSGAAPASPSPATQPAP